MRHLRKYNESKVTLDVEFLNYTFAEFLDREDVQYEYVEGAYWEIFIPIPDIRRIRMTKSPENISIDDYVEVSSKIDDIMKDIQVAMKRVEDEYGDNIRVIIDECDFEGKWWLKITYEKE